MKKVKKSVLCRWYGHRWATTEGVKLGAEKRSKVCVICNRVKTRREVA